MLRALLQLPLDVDGRGPRLGVVGATAVPVEEFEAHGVRLQLCDCNGDTDVVDFAHGPRERHLLFVLRHGVRAAARVPAHLQELWDGPFWSNPIPVSVVLTPVKTKDGVGLLVVRRAIQPQLGKLALVGGFLEDHETWQQGGAREIREESDVVIDPSTLTAFWLASDAAEAEPRAAVLGGGGHRRVGPSALSPTNETSEHGLILAPMASRSTSRSHCTSKPCAGTSRSRASPARIGGLCAESSGRNSATRASSAARGDWSLAATGFSEQPTETSAR